MMLQQQINTLPNRGFRSPHIPNWTSSPSRCLPWCWLSLSAVSNTSLTGGLIMSEVTQTLIDDDSSSLAKRKVASPPAIWQRVLALLYAASVRGTMNASSIWAMLAMSPALKRIYQTPPNCVPLRAICAVQYHAAFVNVCLGLSIAMEE